MKKAISRYKHLDRNGNRLQVGDSVRVIGFRPAIKNDAEFKTRTILKRAVGRIFPIVGFQKDWTELALGEVIGKEPWEEAIWLEPDFVELVEREKKSLRRKNHRTRKKRKRVLK